MKRNFSIIDRFQFKHILSFYLFFIVWDILKLLKVFPKQLNTNTHFLFSLLVGLLLILMSIFSCKYLREMLAIVSLGFSFVSSSLVYLINNRVFLVISILLEIVSIYFFWIAKDTADEFRGQCAKKANMNKP